MQRNQALVRQCNLVTSHAKPLNTFLVEGLEAGDELIEERGEPTEDFVTIPLHNGKPQHIVQIGSKLDKAIKQSLVSFYKKMLIFLLGPLQTCQVSIQK